MRRGFSAVGRRTRVLQSSGELAAIGAAIASLRPGDLLLCQVDQVELALGFVTKLLGSDSISRALVTMSSKPVPSDLAGHAAGYMTG